MQKKDIKRWAISCLLSFITGFSLVLVTDIDMISLETLKNGSIVGVLFASVRGGIKALLEFYLANAEK